MDIFFLGTSGSIPTLKRNLPSLVIRREGELYLFDCGEATQIQIIKSGLSLAKFEAVFITHLHGDHITGLPGFLMLLTQANRTKPLYIFGPPGIEDFIQSIKRTINFYCEYEMVIEEIEQEKVILDKKEFYIETAFCDHNVLTFSYAFVEYDRPGKFYPEKAKELGICPGPNFKKLQNGETITVNGKIITPEQVVGPPRPGRKVVYATDTRPSENIVNFSKDADVLIHDGMFSAEELKDAIEKGHSTAEGAAEVAKAANVKKLFLTHISSRYFSTKLLKQEAQKVFPATKVAYDLMQISVPFSDQEGDSE